MQVDGGERLVERENSRNDHQHGADERAGGPIDVHARDLPKADKEIGDEENNKRGGHGRQCTTADSRPSSATTVQPAIAELAKFVYTVSL